MEVQILNIVMTYIDHNMAGVEQREAFSCAKGQADGIYARLKENPDIMGAVLIATCNRTELYLSLREGSRANPFDELCRTLGADPDMHRTISRTLEGDEAFLHLCRVAAGTESQIWGDGQIITQVRNSIAEARKNKAVDSFLNVIFNKAVCAGKKVRTNVDLRIYDNSTAIRAVARVKADPAVKTVMVIGNGMMGRMIAAMLRRSGIRTIMTLRQYKHGEIVIPDGVETVNYSQRYELMEECDSVISATTSPHYTVFAKEFSEIKNKPVLLIDMAVPRDIDPMAAGSQGVVCLNIDDICAGKKDALQEDQYRQMEGILEKYLTDMHKWKDFRKNMEKKIYVIGIGPGSEEYLTPQARAAVEDSDVIVGYGLYVDLIRDLTEGKTVRSTGMRQEVERCRIALDYAVRGKKVAFVCSGDAGVYGMAGVMSEVAAERPDVEIITIPGITAACSGAAVLGAPLIHDFAVISLSDLLTPWEKIEKRLRLAASADFVICLYNPKSLKRSDYIDKASDIIAEERPSVTPCGYVKNIGREGERGVICTLEDLKKNDDIDMFTTVFIGNSSTKVINGRLVTPRGYREI